jgi:SLT domain-containing protein
VKAGKSSKFEDFVTAGKNLYSLSTTAYGQGPKTASLRKDLLAALDTVLASRSFASGTTATPPGVILVGEQGPELIAQPGGLKVHTTREMQKVVSVIAPVSGPSASATSNLSLVSNSSAAAQQISSSISVKNIASAIEKAAPARDFAQGTRATPPGMITRPA